MNRPAESAAALDKAVQIWPYEMDVHERLAELHASTRLSSNRLRDPGERADIANQRRLNCGRDKRLPWATKETNVIPASATPCRRKIATTASFRQLREPLAQPAKHA